ncbi:hypothetical protein PPERSA_10408 [Pseudocohnilembus persalinus]|uniref:RAP domain-containing protein n=1 Tax=Pseudocohnilembus persalinus TaxID=266149 RepID=A0A0V0QWH4_PSEPJ|nr:hypothetical protein PPERSA_10408 [Pseudocohnilembus persalinus]|eukprot:KRX06550.1 hypothetical protein PPERSA_10408 [Pseudocohnilembus persalinus]
MGVEQLIKYYLSFSTKNFWFEEKYFEKFMNRYYKCLLENRKLGRQDLQQSLLINQQFVVLQEKSEGENNLSINQHQQQEKKQIKKLGQWEIYNGFWILSRNLGDFPIQEQVLTENLEQILEMIRNDLENQNYYDIIGALQGLINWEIYQGIQAKRYKNQSLYQQKQIQEQQMDLDQQQNLNQNQNQKSNIQDLSQDQNSSQFKNTQFFKFYQELCQSIEKKIGNRPVKNSQILSILQQAINYLQLSFQEESQEFFSQKFIESLYQNSNEHQQRASGRNEQYQQQQKQEERMTLNNNNNNNYNYKNQGQKSQTEQQIGEIVIKFFEQKYGLNFQRNVIIGKYECDLGDFNNKRILIEINGERHFNLSFLKNWEKNYSQRQWQEFRQAPYNSNFQMKLKILEMMGYKVLNLDFMEYMMVSQDQIQLENFVHKKIVNFMENL